MTTVNESGLIVDASDDGMVVVKVSWVRPVTVLFVFRWTFEAQEILYTASYLIRPVAALNPVIINQSFWCAFFTFGDAPNAFRVKNVALILIFIKDAELPGTTRGGNGPS